MHNKSILGNCDYLIDDLLGLHQFGKSPHHKWKTSCLHLSENPPHHLKSGTLISSLCNQIESNWVESNKIYNKPASEKNWRFTKQLGVANHNSSAEVTLESKIVDITDENWVNQVPTSLQVMQIFK